MFSSLKQKVFVGFLSLVFLGVAAHASAAAGVDWTQTTSNAPWNTRMFHTSVTANGKIWVMGGWISPNVARNDIWNSSNGATWTQVATNGATTTWPKRAMAASTVFDGKIWTMGGFGEAYVTLNDVWYTPTTDGSTWTQATAAAPWESRAGFGLTTFNDGSGEKMWIAGGLRQNAGTSFLNDVWNSSDGVNWTQVNANAPWEERRYHAFTSFDGKLWVIGGSDLTNAVYNDVWSSSDGVNWTEVTAAAPWGARAGMQVVIADGKMWLSGGSTFEGGSQFNDVWSSSDGVNWTEVTAAAPWGARESHTSLFAFDRLWIIGGGTTQPTYKDVWYSQIVNIDTVTIERAIYKNGKHELTVEARSTQPGGTAGLILVGFGPMTYNSHRNSYTIVVGNIPNPGTVEVTSTFGGSATATVN